MTINAINAIHSNKPRKLSPAIKGAMVGSSVYTVATGLSWFAKRDEMIQSVKSCGGKKEYALATAAGFAAISLFGALSNIILTKIAAKTPLKKHPTAVN
ncbi:hypothetical protein IJ182_00905 [bacterium]|nr:hypothetical protein [bacterium]